MRLAQQHAALQETLRASFADLSRKIDGLQRRPGLPPTIASLEVEEMVEQPRSSLRVTLKSLADSEEKVSEAMARLEELVLTATESALKESKGIMRQLVEGHGVVSKERELQLQFPAWSRGASEPSRVQGAEIQNEI